MKAHTYFTKPLLSLDEMADNFLMTGDPEDCSRVTWIELNGVLASIGIPSEAEIKNKQIELRQDKIARIYKGE